MNILEQYMNQTDVPHPEVDHASGPHFAPSFSAHKGHRSHAPALAASLTNSISATTNILSNTDSPRLELIANLIASGKGRKDIQALLGLSYSTVVNLSNQPVVRERVKSLLSTHGGNLVKAFLTGQVMSSLEVLVEIRDADTTKPSDRISATNAILDRALGKPTQTIETRTSDVKDASIEIAALQMRMVENTAKLRAAGVSLPN
jgi:hypothetical protein